MRRKVVYFLKTATINERSQIFANFHLFISFTDLIHTVAKTGGHLGSSLGVVELTVALHHVFNTPVCWWPDFGFFLLLFS